MFEVIDSPMQQPGSHVSNAVVANGVIYTAQVPRIPATGELMSTGGISAQARQTFENLRTMMASAGGTLKDVAQITIFLTDATDAPEMNRIYKEFFSAPYPNRATVVVQALLSPGMCIELTAHAHVSSQAA